MNIPTLCCHFCDPSFRFIENKLTLLPNLARQQKILITLALTTISSIALAYLTHYKLCQRSLLPINLKTDNRVERSFERALSKEAPSLNDGLDLGINQSALAIELSKITFSNGAVFEGHLENQKDEIIFPQNTQLVVEESVYPDLLTRSFDGQGILSYPNGTTAKGSFIQGKLNGMGSITHSNAIQLEGLFVEGHLTQGKIIYNQSEILEGYFKDNQLNGEGTIIMPDGKIIKGFFQNNLLEGKGSVFDPNGSYIEGIFKANTLIEEKF